MIDKILKGVCCMAALTLTTAKADKVYEESGGLVVMEMENTDSPFDQWQLIAPGTDRYPAGAIGDGHLESTENEVWGVPGTPLIYNFTISKTGTYFLQFRAHKRLEGEKRDKCNDCFVRLEGDFESGDSELPLIALQTDQKLFGGPPEGWGSARMLDLKPKKFGIIDKKHLRKPAAYYLKAGETYTLTVSGRSQRFNLDRIVFSHESLIVDDVRLALLPESNVNEHQPNSL